MAVAAVLICALDHDAVRAHQPHATQSIHIAHLSRRLSWRTALPWNCDLA
jgi:hypothetical protein